MFVTMALMFPWATKEYLLWNMTIGQVVMYHNKAIDIKNGVAPKTGLADKSADELREIAKQTMADVERDELKRKFGDIGGE